MFLYFSNLRKKSPEEGFGMVEVLVSIAILGVITAIALPNYLNQKKSAISASVKQDVSNASIYIAQNQDTLGGHKAYTGQNETTPIDLGIPGFESSNGVAMTVYGSNEIGRYTSCIEGYGVADKSPNRADTTWHIVIDQKEIKKGSCTW